VADARIEKKNNERKKQMKTKTNIIYPAIAIVAVAFVALPPIALAVSPAPDGGYAGGNTAEGDSALFSLTSGIDNTALGFRALYHNNGNYNTAEGFGALYSNTSGTQNTANGVNALLTNTIGADNTADGVNTLFHNTIGNENTAAGYQALFNNTTGNGNTASGVKALYRNTEGLQNTATGYQALYHNTTVNGISGDNNTANGFLALYHNTNGNGNTAIGVLALNLNTTGDENTAIGEGALQNNTAGTGNTVLGANAGLGIMTGSNIICIGTAGTNVGNACYIGKIFNATSSGGTAVFINSSGRLGTATSSRRFKEEIKPMEQASEALFALKPVAFHYKKEIDPAGTPQFGLVAEEVEKVNPDLVVRDQEGKPYSVRYDQVNAMLLNEFLKEHRRVEELENGMAVLTEQLKEQAAQIQKVSGQLAATKPSMRTVLNDH
jgi:hypothetical protein